MDASKQTCALKKCKKTMQEKKKKKKIERTRVKKAKDISSSKGVIPTNTFCISFYFISFYYLYISFLTCSGIQA